MHKVSCFLGIHYDEIQHLENGNPVTGICVPGRFGCFSIFVCNLGYVISFLKQMGIVHKKEHSVCIICPVSGKCLLKLLEAFICF